MARPRGIPFDSAKTKQAEQIKRIVEVSADLFSTKGYLQTSMEDIAEAAGFTKGGAYYYFGNKSDILYFICSTYISLDLENLTKNLSGKKNGKGRLKALVFGHIAHYAGNTSAARTLLHEAYALPPEKHSEVSAMEREYFNMVHQVVSEYLNDRQTKEIVTALTFTLFGMMDWIFSWYDPKGNIAPEKLAEIVFLTFTKGVGAVPVEIPDKAPARKARVGGSRSK